MRFSDLYTKAQFAPVGALNLSTSTDWTGIPESERSAYDAAVRADRRTNQILEQHIQDEFGPACLRWLEHLRSESRLNRIGGIEGRDIRFVDCWNAFVGDNADEFQIAFLMGYLHRALRRAVMMADKTRFSRRRESGYVPGSGRIATEAEIEAGYRILLNGIENGNTDYFNFCIDDLYDSMNGDRAKVEFVDWNASLWIKDMETFEYQTAQSVAPIEMQSIEIDVPSGDLLLSDWIRIPEFKQATDLAAVDGLDQRKLDMCCDQGAINRAKAHAELHGFAHVQTTNTYVGVHQGPDGRLMIAERWDDRDEDEATAEGMEDVGDFSCDLWWVTIIDKKILQELIGKGGAKDPNATLYAYLTSDDCDAQNTVRLKVTPGRYRVHFGPRFHERADRGALRIPEGPEPWCVMERIGNI